MIALRLRIRRDGSLCLTDAAGSVSSPDRAFPDPHGFTYEWLASNSAVAKLDGDTLVLTLANASATYRITDRRPDGVDVDLVGSSLSDAPPIDEVKAAELAELRVEDGTGSAIAVPSQTVEQAFAGSVLVNEKG